MKTTCETKNLRKCIEAVMPGIDSKPASEILSGIKLQTKDNKITLCTSNMNNYYRSYMEAKNEEDDETVVAAERFYNIIKATNEENITLETVSKNKKDNVLSIKAGNASFELSTYSGEFPEEPKPENEPDFSMELTGKEYKEIIKKTAYAVSKDTSRPIFTGIFLNITEESIAFAASNTHRISEYDMKDRKGNKKCSCLIPSQNMTAIAKIIEDEEKITLSFKSNKANIKTENWDISIQAIGGNFPDYRRVFPKPEDKITGISVNRTNLLDAVNRVSICSDTNNKYIVVKMEAENDKLTVSSYGSNDSNSKEIVDCKTEGNPIKIAFNAKYIVEFCKSTTAENITFAMKNELSPVRMHGDDPDKYTYIITPVRVTF